MSERGTKARAEYHREWYEKNKERRREYMREWRRKNKGRIEAQRERYWDEKAEGMNEQ